MADGIVQVAPDNTGKKVCSKCGEEKDRILFSKRTRSVDGLMPQCKTCDAARAKTYQPTIDLECPVCNKHFSVFPYRLKRNEKHAICCSHACGSKRKHGISNARKAGQTAIFSNGYEHIYTGVYGQKAKKTHIILAEKALGRPLNKGEVVHHINCVKTDNRPENLLICTQSYHAWIHQEMGRKWAQENLNG